MGKIIAFVNQKGGVGKTTSSINLAASLGLLGKKTLLVDLDPQGNSTTGVGVNKGDLESSIYELLVDKTEIKKIAGFAHLAQVGFLASGIFCLTPNALKGTLFLCVAQGLAITAYLMAQQLSL